MIHYIFSPYVRQKYNHYYFGIGDDSVLSQFKSNDVHVIFPYQENFEPFGGMCPPPEAIRSTNGRPIIEVIAGPGKAAANVTWAKPQLVNFPENYVESTVCVAGNGTSYPCDSGDDFRITSSYFSDYRPETSVQFTITDLEKEDQIYKCTFFVLVQGNQPLVIRYSQSPSKH